MAMTKHERRLQREQQRARLRATLAEIAEGGAVGKADCAVAVAIAVAPARGKVGGNNDDAVAKKLEESVGRDDGHDRTVGCATHGEAEPPRPTEHEGISVEGYNGGEVMTEETYKPQANGGNVNEVSPPRSTDEGNGNNHGNAIRNEATRVLTVHPDLESRVSDPCTAPVVMKVGTHEERVDQDDAGHELGSHCGAPPAPSIMNPTADTSTAADENQLVLDKSMASLGNETIPKDLIRGVKIASPAHPDESMHRDAVQPTVVQLEDDIERLVRKRQKKRYSCPGSEGNPASTTALSPTPSEAATDATESGGAGELNDRGDAEDLVHIDSKTARIHQLESELALAQRKVDALETEISDWVEAADKQQDFRSQLLGALVKQRTFAERLYRTVDRLDINAGGLNAGASRSVIELFELADELGRPRTYLLGQQDAIDLAESLVFPAQQAVTGCAGKSSTATSWLWENQRTLFAEDYSVRVMRLSEEPLKRRRSDSASDLAIATPSIRTERNAPDLPTSETVRLHSPPQVKRQRVIENDDDSASSDEEEFVCDVDSSGKVTARIATYEPAAREDPGADDIFLAISM